MAPKKQLFIATALLAGIVLMVSCHKEPEKPVAPKAKAEYKGTKAVKTSFIPAGKSSLTAVRNGRLVDLSWQADLAGVTIRKIDITRNSTGKAANREPVATLGPDSVNYQDTLPDANARWYWIRFVTTDGKFQDIGPVRVGNDRAGSVNYINLADVYKISITRTADSAVLKWDFPDDDYDSIKVVRHWRPIPNPFKVTARTAPVVTTTKWKSQHTDAMPDPYADFWYWFRITLKSGQIIERGPIKAEFAKR